MLQSMFYPTANTYNCFDCQPVEQVGYDFFGNPVFRQKKRPMTSYKPKSRARIARNPFNQIFEDDFFGFTKNFDPFDDDFFGVNRRKIRPNKVQKLGKENVHPQFDNVKNCQRSNDCITKLPVPEKPSQPETRSQKPHFFESQFNSNTLVKDGNATTISKKTVTENDKTETFVTKISEDKEGNKEFTNLASESYGKEVKDLFESEGLIIKEVPQQIMAEKDKEEHVDEDKMFMEKIKQYSSENTSSDDNKSKKSDGSSGNMLFSDIKF